jgi:hypothetical protein
MRRLRPDANVTRRVYTKLFDPQTVHDKIRKAQASLSANPAQAEPADEGQ